MASAGPKLNWPSAGWFHRVFRDHAVELAGQQRAVGAAQLCRFHRGADFQASLVGLRQRRRVWITAARRGSGTVPESVNLSCMSPG
jgi:hypothetical protein